MAGRTSHPLPPHGTRLRYVNRVDPCRCPACKRANADDQATRRQAWRAEGRDAAGRYPSGQLAIPPHAYETVHVRR